ncbi:MAG: hypothetical protein HC880_04060 [Bacteroidia bacterium]|nr:hypothetical protein [Bacteroidia bacterium]
MFGIKLKIRDSAFLQLGFIALLIIINFVIVTLYDQDLAEVEKTVDLAESNGTLSQQIMLYAGYVLEGKDEYRKELQDAIEKYDVNLNILREGGKSAENNATISQVPEILISGYFRPVSTLWQNYKRYASIIAEEDRLLANRSLNPEIQEAYTLLEK